MAGRFEHLQKRLGLDEAETLSLESPFDFKRQAVFYVPENLPAPSSPDYTASLTRAMIPVIRAAEGRTFFLFTSHRALREAAALLREEKLEYPLLVQGEAGRRELLDEFRRLGNAVLLGTSSFWEGIDVRGEALSCVIIDKLPFGSPGIRWRRRASSTSTPTAATPSATTSCPRRCWPCARAPAG